MVGFGLANGAFPSSRKAWGLFTHEAHGRFRDLELTHFGAARFLLECGEIDAECFVLVAQVFELFLQGFVARRVDFELRIEVAGEVFIFLFEAFVVSADGGNECAS